ncbi:MAG: SigB/SigF/SigG family RNA polymerase sigma factor [Actinomycetota bacterium]
MSDEPPVRSADTTAVDADDAEAIAEAARTANADEAWVAERFSRRADDGGARDDLVLRFRPLADYLARRFSGRGEPLEDLQQVASMALVKAVDRFDPDRGVKFATFASVTIVGELKRHFRDTGWAVRVPRRLKELSLQVNSVVRDLGQELGRSPTVEEIARRAEVTQDDVLEAMDASEAYSTSSLDAPAPGGDEQMPGIDPGDEDETYELIEEWASVAEELRRVPARERKILYLRFIKDRSQSEIAEEIGISQMHVSRLLSKTLARLRESAGAQEGSEA